ncbi:MAG TPA: histone deacetylase [Polyangiaceae bacterium]|nr:histone deacetylase [Polyangiaceae bacterium]
MKLVFTENIHSLMLPKGHKFPLGKYDRIHAALSRELPGSMLLGAPASVTDLELVHSPDYIRRVREGALTEPEVRRLGFPWSESLALRATRSVGGTLAALAWAASAGAAGHIAGGTHHAFRDRGEGFCVWNDLAVAARVAQRDHGLARVAVVDLDVHQGNGTASLFEGDPSVFTLSLHGARNYPFQKEKSTYDEGLPDGCEDAEYLGALDRGLERVRAFRPSVVLYQAGVDGLVGDRLGRMRLTEAGLEARDARVFALARRLGVPFVATLGGGYGRDLDATVRAHVAVFRGLARALG